MIYDKIKELLSVIDNSSSELIIKDYTPILYFGELLNSKIATIGLNPSDKEYYDSEGKPYNRFLNKQDFQIDLWNEISNDEIIKIKTSFDYYFKHNPYKNWFNRLDDLLVDENYSYYFPFNNLVHFDIIPVATKDKWGRLSSLNKDFLISEFGSYLEYLISESNVEICILNGQSVVDNFMKIFNLPLHQEHFEEWDIITKKKLVRGYGYKAILKKKDKGILVLGFNHNIQSSFGVSKNLVTSIRKWIQKEINSFYEK